METIFLNDIIETSESIPDAGKRLYDILEQPVKTGESVVIDVKDAAMSSVFLNTSIGLLIKDYGVAAVRNLTFRNITERQAKRLDEYIRYVVSLYRERQ